MEIAPFLNLVANAERPFRRGWEAQIFAIVVQLSRSGLFTWAEWTSRLAREIGKPPAHLGEFAPWISALQSLLDEKQVLTARDVALRLQEFEHNHTNTAKP